MYKATWITDSIKQGQLLDKDDYFFRTHQDINNNNNKRFTLNWGCAYTLTEAFKINEISQANKGRCTSANFWKEIEFKGLIPERTMDSLRNFFKVNLKLGLVEYYKKHVSTQKYAHAFQNILRAKPATGVPSLTKDEKLYVRTAIWSEY